MKITPKQSGWNCLSLADTHHAVWEAGKAGVFSLVRCCPDIQPAPLTLRGWYFVSVTGRDNKGPIPYGKRKPELHTRIGFAYDVWALKRQPTACLQSRDSILSLLPFFLQNGNGRYSNTRLQFPQARTLGPVPSPALPAPISSTLPAVTLGRPLMLRARAPCSVNSVRLSV